MFERVWTMRIDSGKGPQLSLKSLFGADWEEEPFLSPPRLPQAPNCHLGMRFFMPEWNERIDPGYDFLSDTPSRDRDPYLHDLYAHEVFQSPIYDGMLLSKVRVDEIRDRREFIERVGVHRFVRFPKNRPIMGDCGAFSYVQEEKPPYSIKEILEYYQRLGFDYGVSIDHVITGPWARPGVREKRYEITWRNLEVFLREHLKGGYTFIPMAAIQGWNPESYARMAKAAIEMGYDYIALGSLTRLNTDAILEILKAVHPHLKSHVHLHLFGIARVNAVLAFHHLGVTSFDSTSPLRRAWMDARANYHTLSGKNYVAIRVPTSGEGGIRIRQIVQAGVADLDYLRKLEAAALKALRDFDRGHLSIEDTLAAVLDYDRFLELPREGVVSAKDQERRTERHSVLYRELLQDQPWKHCDCPICRDLGIETVIFRGSNRNRRRGFHNTYVFYKRLQRMLASNRR